MSKLSQSDIIEQINEKIDPKELLEKINYATEKIQIIGSNLKCFCPIHEEKAFRSLIIDLKKKTFRCSLKNCRGFEGGNLVHFYALYKESPEIRAALDLARLLDLEIDPEVINSMAETFLEEARSAFLERDMEKARNGAAQALNVNPENIDARFLLAQTLEELGDNVTAVKEYRTVAESYASAGDLSRAIEIYEDNILPKEPRNVDILERSVELYREADDTDKAVQGLQKIIEENAAEGEDERNTEYYNRILEMDPDKPEIRFELARLHEKLENLPDAIKVYINLADWYSEKDEQEKALEHLAHVKQIVPENFSSRERMAEIYFLTDRKEDAEQEYLELGELAIEQDEFDTAEEFYRKLLEKYPDSVRAREALISLFEKLENQTALSRECINLADLLEKTGDYERAAQAVRRAKQANPKDINLHEKLISILKESGENDAATEAYFELADIHHEVGDEDSIDVCFEEIRNLQPDKASVRARIAGRRFNYGQDEKAKNDILELTDDLLDDQEYSEALDVIQEGIQVDETFVPFLERRLAALNGLDRKDEAIEVYKRLFEIHMAEDRVKEAEECLREALTIDEKNIFIHQKLVEIYLANDDNSSALSTLLSLNQIYYDENQIEEGIKTARQILEINPETVATRERLAELYSENGEEDKAIEEFRAAAEYYSGMNQYSAAINDLKSVLEIDEDHQDTLFRISELLLKSESFDAAFPYLIRRLEVLKEAAHEDEVVKEYLRILSLQEDQPDLREEYAEYLTSIGRTEEAAAQLRQLSELFRDHENYPKAAGILEELLLLAPDDFSIKSDLADMYARLDIPQEALNYYAQAAAGFRDKGDEKKTIEIYRKILKIEPSEESIREELASLLSSHGEIEESVANYKILAEKREEEGRGFENLVAYQNILEMQPGEKDIREKYAALLEGDGQNEDAAEQYLILAVSSEEEDNLQTAVELTQKAKSLQTENVKPRKKLLKLYQSLGDSDSLHSELVSLGDLYIEQNQTDKAEKQYLKAQKLKPDDIGIGEQLARIFEAREDYDTACKEYQKVSRLYEENGQLQKSLDALERIKAIRPDDIEAREEIARLLVETGQTDNALQEYLELAVITFDAGEIEKAREYLSKIAETAPANSKVRIRGAQLLIEHDQIDDGIREIKDLCSVLEQESLYSEMLESLQLALKHGEEDLELHDFKIKALNGTGDHEAALEEKRTAGNIAFLSDEYKKADVYYASILKERPEDQDALEQRVECALQLDNPENAVEFLLTLKDVFVKEEQIEKAIETAERTLEIQPGMVEVMKSLASLYLKQGKEDSALQQFDHIADYYIKEGGYSEAEDYLSRILEYKPESIPTVRKLAELIYQSEGIDKARRHFKTLLALCREQYEPKEARKEFEEVIRLDPSNPRLELEYARYLVDLDKVADARIHYLKTADLLQDNPETRGQAIKILSELLEIQPDDTELMIKMASLCKAGEDLEGAYDYYNRAAEVFLEKGEVDNAIEQFLFALAIRPQDANLYARVADLYEQTGNIDEAIKSYQTIAGINKEKDQKSANKEIYEKILALDKNLKPTRLKLARLYEDESILDQATSQYLILGKGYEEENEQEKALKIYNHIKEINPGEEENRLRMVEIFLSMDDSVRAREELEDLATLAMQTQRMEDAENYLLRVKELAPDDADAGVKLAQYYEGRGESETAAAEYTRVADIYIKREDFDQALPILLKARELAPDQTTVRERLVKAYRKTGKSAEFKQEALKLAELYFIANRTTDATKTCASLVKFDHSDIDTRMKVAEKYEENNLLAEAMDEYLNSAEFLLEREQYRESDNVCQKGLQLIPDHVPLINVRIKALLGMGNSEQAAGFYLELAEIFAKEDNSEEQEKAYRKAMEIDPSAIKPRQGLIDLLSNVGRVEDAMEELSSLSEIYYSREDIDGAVKTHQDMLLLQPDNLSVREGLASLYKEMEDLPAAVQEFFNLARAYEEAGDWDAAHLNYQEILDLEPKNVEALRSLIEVSKNQNDTESYIQYSRDLAEHFESLNAWADAIPLYRGIIKEDETQLFAYQKLAACYEGTDEVDEAVSVYKSLAEQYEKNGAYEAAISQLEAVEKHWPEDAGNMERLAELSLKAGRPEQAILYYSNAIEILQALGDVDQATDLACGLIEVDKNRIESYNIRAELYKTAGYNEEAAKDYSHMAMLYDNVDKTEDAVEAREQVLHLFPEDISEIEKYTHGLRKLGRSEEALRQSLNLTDEFIKREKYDKAEEWARQALAINPSDSEAHIKLKNVYLTTGKTESAVNEILWLARFYLEKELTEEAEKVILEGLELDEENIDLRGNLVEVYINSDQQDKATEQLLKITGRSLFLGDLIRAISSMEKARDLVPDNVELRRNLAELYLRNEQSDKAREEHFYAANLCLQQGLVERAEELCESILTQSPKDADLRERVALMFKEHDIPELASKHYLEITDLKKSEGLHEEVIQYAEKALDLNPRSVKARENRVESLMKLDRTEQAYEELNTLAEIYSNRGFVEKARDAYDTMVQIEPKDPLPRKKLVSIYALINNYEQQVKALRSLAELYDELDRAEDAVEAYHSLLELIPDDTRSRVRYIDIYSRIGPEKDLVDDYLKLIDIYIKHGALAEATRIFEKLGQITPDDPAIRERFIKFLLSRDEEQKAFDEMLSLSGIYVEQGAFRKATSVLGQAVRIAPDDPKVHLKLGEAYVLMNARGMAVQEYQKAARLFETEGEDERSLEIYEKIINIDPQNLDARREYIERLKKADNKEELIAQQQKLADLYIERGLLDLAENVYREILKIDRENLEIWNFLIQTHLQIGLEEDLVDDYLDLAEIYLEDDSTKEALEQLRKVIDAQPGNVDVRRRYIDVYLQIGLENDLVDDYLELADALVERGDVDEAIRLYSHVMSLDPENPDAMTKLSETRARYRKEEEQVALESMAEAEDASEETKPEPSESHVSSMQEAMENYQNILDVNPSNANIRCKLAEIYIQMDREKDALSEWEKASETFILKGELNKGIDLCEKILEREPSNAKIRERLSKAILQRDSFKAIESAISAFTDTFEPGLSSEEENEKEEATSGEPPSGEGETDKRKKKGGRR